MSGTDYHGRNSRSVSNMRVWGRLVLLLAAGMLLSGCFRRYDILGRPMIIDASRRQGSQETLAARRSDPARSHPMPSDRSYRRGSPESTSSYPRGDSYSGSPEGMSTGSSDTIGSARSAASAYPMGAEQRSYRQSGYTMGYSGQPGQPDPSARGYQRSGEGFAPSPSQSVQRNTAPPRYPDGYPYSQQVASVPGASVSQGYPPANPSSPHLTERRAIQDVPYNQNNSRERASVRNYPPAIPPGGGVYNNPASSAVAGQSASGSPLPSSRPVMAYGHSSSGMPEASLVSVTEAQSSVSSDRPATGSFSHPGSSSLSVVTTGVEPVSSQGGFSSNIPPSAPSFPVPNPSSGRRDEFVQPAVSVPSPGYAPAGMGMATVITELERNRDTNANDLHTSLALHYLYMTQQEPDKADRFLPENEGDANRMLELLDQVRDKVAQRADFVISRMKLCDKVTSFGNYHELNLSKLETGEAQKVYVYCELENFQSKRDIEGRYLSDIFITITLYDSRYTAKCQKAVPVNDTPSYSRRQDFFLIGDLSIPKLSPGQYFLRVEVEDKIAGKRAKPKEIVFEVKK